MTKEDYHELKLRTTNRIHELEARHQRAIRLIKARAWDELLKE